MTYRNPDTEARILERLDSLHAQVSDLKPEADPSERTARVAWVVVPFSVVLVVGLLLAPDLFGKSDAEECAVMCGARGVSRFVDSSGGKDTCECIDHKRIPTPEAE
jgi:hypothetical protein